MKQPVVDRRRDEDSWYAKDLGDATLADEALARIEALFSAAHEAAGRPADMAVFVRHESAGRLHCTVMVHFPPAAAAVARAVSAVAGPSPSPAGLGLLAGESAAWSVLFPEAAGRG